MRHGDPRLGHELGELLGLALDRGDPVVDVEHLALAHELAPDGGGDLLVGVGAHVGEHGVALLRRGGQGGGLADAGQRHLEGARDGGRGHRQDVHVGPHRLELLLVLHAEALLLVDDHEAEVLELDLLGQQPVGADHHVHGPVLQPGERLLGLLGGLEPGERGQAHREAGEALGERLGVLLGQQRGGHEHGDLLAVLHGLERRAHRHLGLAVAHVPGDQPVHGDLPLHVRLDLVDGGQLVRRLDVGERLLELALPRGVLREGVPAGGHPRRVQADQLVGDVPDGLLGGALGLVPVRPAHLGQGGGLAAHVVGDLVQLVGGHEQAVPRAVALGGRVLEHQVLTYGLGLAGLDHRPGDGPLDELHELADAVLLVHHEVALAQRQGVHGVALAPHRELAHVLGGVGAGLAQQVRLGEQHDPRPVQGEALAGHGGGELHDPGLRLLGEGLAAGGGDPGLVQQLRDPGQRTRALRDGDDAPAVGHPPLQELEHRLDVPVEAQRVPGGHGEGVGVRVDEGDVLRGGVRVHVLTGHRVDVERGDGPPAETGPQRGGPGLGEGLEGPGGQGAALAVVVADDVLGGGDVDGRGLPVRGGLPRGEEELLVGGHEVVGAGADLLRLHDHHERAGREQGQHGHQAVHQQGREGLHALHVDAAGDPLEHGLRAGQGVLELRGPGHHGRGDEHLAARRGHEPLRVVPGGQGALVGHGEPAQLVDLVPEELDPHRVVLDRREHVDDPAAHGELPAPGDHVHPGVGGLGERGHGGVEVELLAPGEAHRGHVPQAFDDGLEHGADRGRDHPQRALGVLAGQPAQHVQAAAHSV